MCAERCAWPVGGPLGWRAWLRVNENLRRAMLRARLREDDVAARLDVDPKTVRRWLEGRVPYPGNRAALAALVGADEAALWPEAGEPLAIHARPDELGRVYPHRWAIPRETWVRFFASAEQEIGVLAYSALFLAEDAGLLGVLANRARSGVQVHIALGDPESSRVADRGAEEGIGDAMPPRSVTPWRCSGRSRRARLRRPRAWPGRQGRRPGPGPSRCRTGRSWGSCLRPPERVATR